MPTFFSTSQTVPLTGLTNSAWNTVDISSIVPSNTTAVMYSTHNSVGFTEAIWARGTTDTTNYVTGLHDGEGNHDFTNGCGCAQVHGGNSIDIYFQGGATASFLSIWGYFTSSELALPNSFGNSILPYSMTTLTAATWTTIDLTSWIAANYSNVSNVYGVVMMPWVGPTDAGGFGCGSQGIRPIGSSIDVAARSTVGDQGGTTWIASTFVPGQGYKLQVYVGTAISAGYFNIIGLLTQDCLRIATQDIPYTVGVANAFTQVSLGSTLDTTCPTISGGLSTAWMISTASGTSLGLNQTSGGGSIFPSVAPHAGFHFSGGMVAAAPLNTSQTMYQYTGVAAATYYIAGKWIQPSAGQLFFGTNF